MTLIVVYPPPPSLSRPRFISSYTGINQNVGTLFGVVNGFDSAGLSITEADRQQVFGTTSLLMQYSTFINVAPGSTSQRRFTVRVNGVDSALTILYGSTESGYKTVVGSVSIQAGDQISISSTVINVSATAVRLQNVVEFQ